MTQEEKQLLIKDICARLPYGVIIKSISGDDYGKVIDICYPQGVVAYMGQKMDAYTEEFLPYLRPMSSMTEGELREFAKLKFKNDDVWEIVEFPEMKFGFKGLINVRCRNKNIGDTWIYQVNARTPLKTYWGIDWLNEHHFDYRGLIEKGLALEAEEWMYK